jgi:hypothetical protein
LAGYLLYLTAGLLSLADILSTTARACFPHKEAGMGRHAFSDFMEEAVTVLFLTLGPALGAAIALIWLVGLIYGTFAVLFR